MTRFTLIECSDFNLLNRFDAGEDITPVLEQRASIGFNCLRIWTAYNIGGIGRLVPRERPNLYQHIPELFDVMAAYGLYGELTAFTGPYGGIFDFADQMIAHWEALISAVLPITNLAYVELVNEADNAPNQGLPMDRLRRPYGILASHGSNVQDARPVEPFWDVATYRPASSEWQRKVGHNAMEIWNGPTVSNETTRMPDNDANPDHAYDAAAGATLLCAGACFHSVHGKSSDLFDGQELVCAQAWVNGAKSVPLDYQAGPYTHRSDKEGGNIIRAYERPVAGLPEHVVEIRA